MAGHGSLKLMATKAKAALKAAIWPSSQCQWQQRRNESK